MMYKNAYINFIMLYLYKNMLNIIFKISIYIFLICSKDNLNILRIFFIEALVKFNSIFFMMI